MQEPNTPARPGFMRRIHLRTGLNLIVAGFRPPKDMKMHFETDASWLQFTFFLEGNGYMEQRVVRGSTATTMRIPIERCASASFYPKLSGTIFFPAGHRQSHLTIQITPSLLNTFMSGRFDRMPPDLEVISDGCTTIDFSHNGPLSPVMDDAIRQLIACPYSGGLGQIYQEGRATELIAHKLAQIQSSSPVPAPSGKLRPDEMARVNQARTILMRDLEDPPKLFDLARAVGTTHTQLNLGFRKIYGTSTFGYLRQLRLIKARHLLEQGRMNVTEAACAVGYTSLSSFSRAFSAHFGVNPLRCVKKDPTISFQTKKISNETSIHRTATVYNGGK